MFKFQHLPHGLLEVCILTSKSVAGSRAPAWLLWQGHRHTLASRSSSRAASSYIPTIGLELHVQLKTSTKLFSSAPTSFDASPNIHVAPCDAALPGALPVLNAEPVRLAAMAALALGCQIHTRSKFDRKHYFYPDLPAGFQITQKYEPLATNGAVVLSPRHDGLRHNFRVGITQIQLEQDTAKSMHDNFSGQTLLDLNRAGTPLIEVISEPDMHSAEEAAAYVRKVQSILRAVGASDADMEKGSLRIDVNVSLAREGATAPGVRCEIKNLNSVRSMTDAITYETERQSQILASGDLVEQQTRGFDAMDGTTIKLRSKSDAPDYRYMPDPELAPLILPEDVVQALRSQIPLLPDQIRDKLENEYNLPAREVDILVRMSDESDEQEGPSGLGFFEEVANGRDARTAANWILHDLQRAMSKHNETFASCTLKPHELGSLIDAVDSRQLTTTHGKAILSSYFEPTNTLSFPDMLAKATKAVSGSTIDYQQLASEIIGRLPREAEKVRKGNMNVLARLIGEGMKRSKGQAKPEQLKESLLEDLFQTRT